MTGTSNSYGEKSKQHHLEKGDFLVNNDALQQADENTYQFEHVEGICLCFWSVLLLLLANEVD